VTRQGERRADSCYGWNRSSAPPCGAGGKSRRVAINGASGRFELDWRLGAFAARSCCDVTVFMGRQSEAPPKKRGPPATGKGEPILVRTASLERRLRAEQNEFFLDAGATNRVAL
jgi:hypothetical protein